MTQLVKYPHTLSVKRSNMVYVLTPQLILMKQVTLHLHTRTEVISGFMLRSFLTAEIPEGLIIKKMCQYLEDL